MAFVKPRGTQNPKEQKEMIFVMTFSFITTFESFGQQARA
jgi:hypothetical protein